MSAALRIPCCYVDNSEVTGSRTIVPVESRIAFPPIQVHKCNSVFSISLQSPKGPQPATRCGTPSSLARLADRMGYHRYWVAEHHGTPGLACTSPEVLIGPIAAATSKIRVGSGGIMLPHYSPLKVAENFNMLSGLFPGRIDLGIGRAAGTSPNVARALQRDRRQPPPDDFPDQLDELLMLSAEAAPHLLGSSVQSAIWAAELGLPYVFADFINSDGAAIAANYRQRFRPSHYAEAPRLAVAAWAVCANTDEEAMRLSSSFRMMMRLLLRGRLIAVPTVEIAERFLAQDTAPLFILRAL